METTQGKVVAAFVTLARMSQKPMNSFAAYKLFRLKKALMPIVEFQTEQETRIIDELGGTITDKGAVVFDSKEKREEYDNRHKELEALTCEVATGKVSMVMKELPEITMADMETLEEFIDWKE